MKRRQRKQRRAAAVVEFAVIAPIFLLIVFGIVEFGRMIMVQHLLTNASREGARHAVLDGSTVTDVRSVVIDYLAAGQLFVTDEDISVTPDPRAAAFGDPINVAVKVPFSKVSWLPNPLYADDAELQAVTVMRRETSQ